MSTDIMSGTMSRNKGEMRNLGGRFSPTVSIVDMMSKDTLSRNDGNIGKKANFTEVRKVTKFASMRQSDLELYLPKLYNR